MNEDLGTPNSYELIRNSFNPDSADDFLPNPYGYISRNDGIVLLR